MLKRRRIVAIVDDDPSMLRATEYLLDAHGFETKVFASAEEFLDCAAAAYADCLLLDIHLGGMSGIELRRQLKASGSTLSVIFMTARDDEATLGQALTAGCIACLRKPFPARQLIDAIEKAALWAGEVCGNLRRVRASPCGTRRHRNGHKPVPLLLNCT